MVSSESLRQVLRPANVLKLRRVSEVMSTPVIKAHLNTSVQSLAQLMAKHRVSCVVIVEELATSYDLPMGIVTERDIVQFQSLQLNFSQTFAEMVMSTPLFLLSPEDSLWTAHQQMQKRRVRRLVVSWNWGMGLGIVTQTSLLRIFDPVEMYGVVQTLQQTVKQLEEEKTNAEDTEGLNPEISSPLPTSLDREGNANIQPPLTPHGLRLPLSSLRTHLEQLRDRSDLSVQQQQAILTQALAQLADLEHSIDGSAENLEANMGGSDRLSV